MIEPQNVSPLQREQSPAPPQSSQSVQSAIRKLLPVHINVGFISKKIESTLMNKPLDKTQFWDGIEKLSGQNMRWLTSMLRKQEDAFLKSIGFRRNLAHISDGDYKATLFVDGQTTGLRIQAEGKVREIYLNEGSAPKALNHQQEDLLRQLGKDPGRYFSIQESIIRKSAISLVEHELSMRKNLVVVDSELASDGYALATVRVGDGVFLRISAPGFKDKVIGTTGIPVAEGLSERNSTRITAAGRNVEDYVEISGIPVRRNLALPLLSRMLAEATESEVGTLEVDSQCDALKDNELSHSITPSIEESIATDNANSRLEITQESADRRKFVSPKEVARHNIQALRIIADAKSQARKLCTEEVSVVKKYSGWGACAKIFDERKDEWNLLREELKTLVRPCEYQSAKRSILNAYYTPPEMVSSIWTALEKAGFPGGRILEPSCGSGLFIEHQPHMLRTSTKWTAVELEPLTARVATALHSDATIHNRGFEEVIFEDGNASEKGFDLVISNVPFGDYKLFDPVHNPTGERIHNHFIEKSVNITRPGGLVVVITSTGTLQAEDALPFRKRLSEKADLLCAVRIPGGAFKKTGTEVTTDLLVFQKREQPSSDEDGRRDWVSLSESSISDDNGKEMKINSYFKNNPENVLGKLVDDNLWPGRLAVATDGRDVLKELEEHLHNSLHKIKFNPARGDIRQSDQETIPVELIAIPQRSYVRWQDRIWQRQGDTLKETSPEKREIIGSMLNVRKALHALFEAERQYESDDDLRSFRETLNTTYDDFRFHYGFPGG